LAGDLQAFGQIIRKYQDRLINPVLQILRNQADAEDVVQTTFVLALTRLDSYRGDSSLLTWLYRIAVNAAKDAVRRRGRTMASLDHDGYTLGSVADALSDPQEGPERPLERQEEIQMVHQALERLPTDQRTVLVLREMEELDYQQIAQILDIPVGTVRSRLHRARLQLKQELEQLQSQSSADR
jgi:RNA polymerase sigma-70 factor (ECF subfamily)